VRDIHDIEALEAADILYAESRCTKMSPLSLMSRELPPGLVAQLAHPKVVHTPFTHFAAETAGKTCPVQQSWKSLGAEPTITPASLMSCALVAFTPLTAGVVSTTGSRRQRAKVFPAR